jgi:hypothetical protein
VSTRARSLVAALALSSCVGALAPAGASAGVCGAVGWVSGAAGKACNVVQHGDRLLKAGQKILTGHPGGALHTVLGGGGGSGGGGSGGGGSGGGGSGGSGSSGGSGGGVRTAAALAAIVAWTVVGSRFALRETAKVINDTTSPRLTTTWFSSTYWRIAGIAALLTLPFLFAAAVQALLRSDLSLLARAALGYLPLSLLAVGVAAPITMLLLAASDQMSAVVSAAAGNAGARFLGHVGLVFGTLSLLAKAPFLVFLVGLLTAGAAITLWIEMLTREAAVYIVVLMLPLAFAAMVWPARRVWAIRAVELLVALILSKFAIVAVLALGGAALGQEGSGGAAGMLTGLVLVLLAAFAPWALLRLLPLAELASSAAGHLRGEVRAADRFWAAEESAERGFNWAGSIVAGMRRQAGEAETPVDSREPIPDPAPRPAEASPRDTAAVETQTDAEEPSAERSPGMEPMWQADDETWEPIVLGTDDGWPPKRVWPPEEDTAS